MTYELELLNENLIKERDELKETITKLENQIKELSLSVRDYFSKFCIVKIPFGLPNDTKNIEVMMTKTLYEKEIIPYNQVLQALINAKPKQQDEIKTE